MTDSNMIDIQVDQEEMDVVCERPDTLLDARMHYCPGCGHGVAHRVLMEVIDEMGMQEKTIGVAPVGCSVFAYHYMNVDMQEAAHGRACAVATGIKRVRPDSFVFTYQGDGDLAAIGTAETVHAINRGENILIVFINNAIYGMTGGQMAPTTLIGQKSTTSPYGRDVSFNGHPLKITEMIAQLPGAFYVTRQAVNTPSNVRKTKKAIQNAVKYQKLNKGTCFVEVVSNCPTNWGMPPKKSNEWVAENMFPMYPLGDVKLPSKEDVENA
jgi:2-oxoglutarate/2-oxoacid ferredoxin oxidoreductase subunit beta